MATRKNRIPLTQEVSDTVMVAFDGTCCICRTPGHPVQIHHIDENPANNELPNLAVLCLECHHKTQIRGGFAKGLTPGIVKRQRDEWLQIVMTRKFALITRPPDNAAPQPVRRTMTPEQARRHAERLRLLYLRFFNGVLYLQHFAEAMSRPWDDETWYDRGMRNIFDMEILRKTIWASLPYLQIEPGTRGVLRLYGDFIRGPVRTCLECAAADSNYHILHGHEPDHPFPYCDETTIDARAQLDLQVEKLQAAIQKHILSVDQLT